MLQEFFHSINDKFMALFNPSLLGPLPNKYEITALCYMTKRIHGYLFSWGTHWCISHTFSYSKVIYLKMLYFIKIKFRAIIFGSLVPIDGVVILPAGTARQNIYFLFVLF